MSTSDEKNPCEESYQDTMSAYRQEYEKLSKVYQKYISRLQEVLPAGCTLIQSMLKKLPWGDHMFCAYVKDYIDFLENEMGREPFHAGLDGKQPFKSQIKEHLCTDCENERCPNYRKSTNDSVTDTGSLETVALKLMMLIASDSKMSFPQGCLHFVRMAKFPDWWAHEILGRLNQEMTVDEILLGHQLKQPHLDKMRSISCDTCQDSHCKFSFKYEIKDAFSDLMGRSAEVRHQKAEELLEQILPSERRKELLTIGIRSESYQFPSRKSPSLHIHLKREGLPDQHLRLKFPERTMDINHADEQPLISVEQVQQEVEKAIKALL